MVEKEQKGAASEKKPVEKVTEKKDKEKDTLPIDTDELSDNKHQELNNDDEFEEFPIYQIPVDHPQVNEDIEVTIWEDNWEDETVEKDFSIQLSEELGNKEILKQVI